MKNIMLAACLLMTSVSAVASITTTYSNGLTSTTTSNPDGSGTITTFSNGVTATTTPNAYGNGTTTFNGDSSTSNSTYNNNY